MSYSFSTINLPLRGEMSCEEQHDFYNSEKIRVEALVAELGAVAASCHKLHSDYEIAFSANAVAAQEKADCAVKHSSWLSANSAYQAALAGQKNCKSLAEDYKKKKKAYDAAVKDHSKYVTSKTSSNSKIEADNKKLQSDFDKSLAEWNQRNMNYQAYKINSANLQSSLEAQFQKTLSADKNLQKYDWQFRTQMCHLPMRCKTKSWQDSKQSKCNPVRGLGATSKPVADDCLIFNKYPYCPDCPTQYPEPGPKPMAPKFKALEQIQSLPDYLNSKKVALVPPKPSDMDCKLAVPDPGKAPTCDPNATLPVVPPKPTCVPPEIPLMPVAPTCELSTFSQTGAMWLLLAAGAGALYWYAQKK